MIKCSDECREMWNSHNSSLHVKGDIFKGEKSLKGSWYGSLQVVKTALKFGLKNIPIDDFQGTFNDWNQEPYSWRSNRTFLESLLQLLSRSISLTVFKTTEG
ncbi:hypothetical protein TNCV_441631 [Trichonephila clavipes]|nr:hypothetical protein TNCV_441631 [Trichonephila clavipes]